MSRHIHASGHNPDQCTACTICLTHCPVAAATLKFRGPKLTGPAYERFRLYGFEDDSALEYCSNCKNCEISCPSGVPVAAFNMLARAEYCKEHTPPLRDWALAHSGDLGKLTGCLPGSLLNLGMNNPLSRAVMHAFGIEKKAPLPRFGALADRNRLRRHTSAVKAGRDKTLAFFAGCFIRYYDPQTGLDLIELLERAGYAVVVPEAYECCGLPLVAGGYADDALDKARLNSMELAKWARQGIPTIVACPSCALMLRHEYRELFCEEQAFGIYADFVLDACEFLTERIRTGDLTFNAGSAPASRIAYHAPCHLRAQGAGRTGLGLLRTIPGLTAVDTDAGCCGISGSYGFKRGKYAIGMDVGEKLFMKLKESGAPLAASECGTCRVQMRHGSGIEAAHPISILLRSLGG